MEVNNPKQANEVMGCIGWVLNDDEVSMLESATDLCSQFLSLTVDHNTNSMS